MLNIPLFWSRVRVTFFPFVTCFEKFGVLWHVGVSSVEVDSTISSFLFDFGVARAPSLFDICAGCSTELDLSVQKISDSV